MAGRAPPLQNADSGRSLFAGAAALGRDLSRGMRLFHALYPLGKAPGQTSVEGQRRSDEGLSTARVAQIPVQQSVPRRQASESDASPRHWGIERELDEGRSWRRQKGRKNGFISSTAAVAPLQPSQQCVPECKYMTSAAPPTASERSSKKLLTRINFPVYLKLPPLPFGSHRSYNEISSLRDMIISAEDDLQCRERTGKVHHTAAIKEEEEAGDYAKFALEVHRAYLRDSSEALTFGKRQKKQTLPARLLKHISISPR